MNYVEEIKKHAEEMKKITPERDEKTSEIIPWPQWVLDMGNNAAGC